MNPYKQATKACVSIAVLTGACAVNAQSTVALHGIADASVRCTDGLGIDYGPSGAATGAYRLDNSVKYSGKFSDFTVQATHAFGEQAASSSALSSSGVGMSYQTADVAATLGYAEFKSAANLQLKGYVAATLPGAANGMSLGLVHTS